MAHLELALQVPDDRGAFWTLRLVADTLLAPLVALIRLDLRAG